MQALQGPQRIGIDCGGVVEPGAGSRSDAGLQQAHHFVGAALAGLDLLPDFLQGTVKDRSPLPLVRIKVLVARAESQTVRLANDGTNNDAHRHVQICD